MEIVVTQLVFEHSLRIRFQAETGTSKTVAESRLVTGAPSRAESHSTSQHNIIDVMANTDPGVNPTSASTSQESSSVLGASTVPALVSALTNASRLKGPPKEGSNTKAGGNLVGKLNNLITTDLNNITATRGDFLLLGLLFLGCGFSVVSKWFK